MGRAGTNGRRISLKGGATDADTTSLWRGKVGKSIKKVKRFVIENEEAGREPVSLIVYRQSNPTLPASSDQFAMSTRQLQKNLWFEMHIV